MADQHELPFSMITWIYGEQRITEEVSHGINLMTAAQMHQVPNVVGECGGCLSCATCHVVVSDAWVDKVNQFCGAPNDHEDMMLDIVASGRQTNSRLSCQLIACAQLNGLELTVPQD